MWQLEDYKTNRATSSKSVMSVEIQMELDKSNGFHAYPSSTPTAA
ncbi:MAG: hypothetical protein NT179_10700 [Nitrospirae bacterium]|nr:hypothetical protein [Nitrospirota bacterium]